MKPRRPAAFSLEEVRYEPADLYPGEAEELAALEATATATAPAPRGRRWLGLFFAALGGIIAMAIGVAIDNLVRDLFARNDWLGWIALALVALAGLTLIVMALREIVALMRLRRVNHIHAKAVAAVEADDRPAALEDRSGAGVPFIATAPRPRAAAPSSPATAARSLTGATSSASPRPSCCCRSTRPPGA